MVLFEIWKVNLWFLKYHKVFSLIILYCKTFQIPSVKDEAGGKKITQVAAVHAKSYSYTVDDSLPAILDPITLQNILDSEDRAVRCAGVKRSVAEKSLRHEEFLETILYGKYQRVEQCNLRSRGHRIFLEKCTRIGLNPVDLKRIISDDDIHTVPYGYFG